MRLVSATATVGIASKAAAARVERKSFLRFIFVSGFGQQASFTGRYAPAWPTKWLLCTGSRGRCWSPAEDDRYRIFIRCAVVFDAIQGATDLAAACSG